MSREKKSGAKISGNPRKRQAKEKADLSLKSEETRRKALLMSKVGECTDEALRLMELFEEQHSESPGFLYDEIPYMITLSAIVMHRAACELYGEPEKYNISEQLDILELTPAIRAEIEFFLIKNQMDKPETWSIFDKESGFDAQWNKNSR
ncbi:hypothetical protein JEM67_00490 (plasmid) [Serratia sp. PAMC26656]|uniref:hypothetical protein n=1 Tax=Serratia sp. PAMC26656 TaxID=2775909 RepID=UPI0018F428C6|nr:hypothetical protein [Serratia sp. PAMC26656]MBJ7889475.1 hypothetical protein [Serratia sp. PAMC26656]